MNKIKKNIKFFLGKYFPISYSKIKYYLVLKKKINLKNPKLFNEKLMYIKLNNYFKNEIVWKCADKYYVREYALSKGFKEKNLPKLIGVYQNAEDIPFKKLPKKVAIKCSHGCGFNIITQNIQNINIEKVKKQLSVWMKTKFGYENAENHYTHIKPHILVEEYIDSNEGLPYDFKIYCFNGVPKGILVCSEREKKLKLNYYNLSWEELPYINEKYLGLNSINKPKHLDEMIKLAKKVSKDFPFVRVDFYEYRDTAIMGEMTFTPACCWANYYTEIGEVELGKLLDITKQ